IRIGANAALTAKEINIGNNILKSTMTLARSRFFLVIYKTNFIISRFPSLCKSALLFRSNNHAFP
ncbi:MAG: hypothetical protein K2K87_03230, partial [Lachnospiraceae bacterium]|nr:hypothetical protein [Lachnospiraceae bacterium]